MDTQRKGFQAVRITLKHPDTGAKTECFFAGIAGVSPQEFEEMFLGSEHKLEEVIANITFGEPMSFEDMASYPEFKELLEYAAEGMAETNS